MRSGDYVKANEAFDREFKVSKDTDAIYNKACAQSLAGKNAEALNLLEQSIKTGSVDADHMEDDPDLMPLHKEARFDQLVTLAQDLSLYNGDWWRDVGVWKWNGNDDKRWRKAVPHYEEIAKKYPDVGRAWFNLGYAQLESGSATEGTVSFKKALDLGYRPETTMYNLACAAAQSGDKDAAFSWLEKAEGAGMEMWSRAYWDDDLDPLHSDPRYKTLKKKWKAEARDKHDHFYEWSDHDGDMHDDDENDAD